MSEKPSWFRFHLLTLVLMMIGASGLMMANFHRQDSPPESDWVGAVCGFPFPAYSTLRQPYGDELRGRPIRLGCNLLRLSPPDYKVGPFLLTYGINGWSFALVVINFCICLIAVGGVALLSESVLRRREARKT